jgi:hypothetical protein
VVKALTALIDQLPTLMPNATIMVDGKAMTTAQVVAQLRSFLTEVEQLIATRALAKSQTAALKTSRSAVQTTVVALKPAAAGILGASSAGYAALGFQSAARAVPTAEAKATATERRLATRAARGITGKRQRAKIHAPAPAPAPTSPAPATPAATVVKPSGG